MFVSVPWKAGASQRIKYGFTKVARTTELQRPNEGVLEVVKVEKLRKWLSLAASMSAISPS